MANYKNLPRLHMGGIEIQYSGVPIYLTEQTIASGSADAMQRNSLVYQVQAGKTFHGRGVGYILDATGGGTLAIWQGDTEDAVTALQRTVDLPASTVAGTYHVQYAEFNIAAGKFITIVPSGTQVLFVEIFGDTA